MDVLREREVKDSLERQLTEEQKLRGEHEKSTLISTKINNRKSNFLKCLARHVRGKSISLL